MVICDLVSALVLVWREAAPAGRYQSLHRRDDEACPDDDGSDERCGIPDNPKMGRDRNSRRNNW